MADGARLESVFRLIPNESSNLSLSAKIFAQRKFSSNHEFPISERDAVGKRNFLRKNLEIRDLKFVIGLNAEFGSNFLSNFD